MATTNTEEAFDNANIGLLSEFPREMRDLIWDELVPHRTHKAGYGDLSIMRTCKQIHYEVSRRLYHNEKLLFHIQGAPRPWSGATWRVYVRSSRGRHWYREEFESPTASVFRRLPYHKLRQVQVKINAPPSDDPIELYSMWKQVRSVVELLSNSKPLQRLDITPSDLMWTEDGEPKMSIAHTTNAIDGSNEIFDYDYKIALLPFCRLRGVQEARIHVPEGLQTAEFALVMCILLLERKNKLASGFLFDPWIDDMIQKRLCSIYLDFEHVLDTIPGRTGSLMRRNRFAEWFGNGDGTPTYFENWIKWQKGGDWLRNLSQLDRRYQNLLLFNPRSPGMQALQGYEPGARWNVLNSYHPMSCTCTMLRREDAAKISRVARPEIAPSMSWRQLYGNEGIPPLNPSSYLIQELQLWGRPRQDNGQWAEFVEEYLAHRVQNNPDSSEAEMEEALKKYTNRRSSCRNNPKKKERRKKAKALGAAVASYMKGLVIVNDRQKAESKKLAK